MGWEEEREIHLNQLAALVRRREIEMCYHVRLRKLTTSAGMMVRSKVEMIQMLGTEFLFSLKIRKVERRKSERKSKKKMRVEMTVKTLPMDETLQDISFNFSKSIIHLFSIFTLSFTSSSSSSSFLRTSYESLFVQSSGEANVLENGMGISILPWSVLREELPSEQLYVLSPLKGNFIAIWSKW